jgi:hypothetical protein
MLTTPPARARRGRRLPPVDRPLADPARPRDRLPRSPRRQQHRAGRRDLGPTPRHPGKLLTGQAPSDAAASELTPLGRREAADNSIRDAP